MVKWFLGTMGFSYPDWAGPFYPQDADQRDYLQFYSQVFNSVEIDSTFYGIPRQEVVERWDAITPPDFKICAKMPKLITHEHELVGAAEPLANFVDVMRRLGDKLGVILIQFSPAFSVLKRPQLAAFLKDLPPDIRFAVEVRHRSWYTEKTAELLREHHVAWAATEYRHLPKQIYQTADFLYVRFIGWHGRFKTHESERLDVSYQLQWWWENIQEHIVDVHAVYGYFNNDYSGFAAATCNRFKSMFGFEVKPLAQPPKQPRLF